MKILKSTLLILFVFPILFLQNNSFADQPAGIFLELPTSARAGGMAECFTALADDPFGAFYNPAGISFIKKSAASFLYQQYLQDINGSFVALAIPGKKFSFNAAPGMIAMKEEPVYDPVGNDTGRKFNFQGTIIPVSGAYRFNNLSFGATAKYYKEVLDGAAKDVTTCDIGAIYKFRNISLGVSYLNLSGKFGGYDLSKTIKFGAAYTIRSKINLLFDYNSQITLQKNTYNFGGEVPVSDFMFIRAGYKSKDVFGGLSYGLGFKMGKFDIDFAASSYGDLGTTQRAALSYCFGSETMFAEKEELLSEPVKKESRPKPVKKIDKKVNIAVMELTPKNISAEEATLITDKIRNELSSSGFNILEKTNMTTLLAERNFSISGCSSKECAVEAGKILNVKIVVIGTISTFLRDYYITALIVDVETGNTLKSIIQKGVSVDKLKNACDKAFEKN